MGILTNGFRSVKQKPCVLPYFRIESFRCRGSQILELRKPTDVFFIASPCQNRSLFPKWRDLNCLFRALDLAEKTGLAVPQILDVWSFLPGIETKNVLRTYLDASPTSITTLSIYFLNSHIPSMVALIGFKDRVFGSLCRWLERISIDRHGFFPEFEFTVHLLQHNPLQPLFIIDKGEVFAEMGSPALFSHQGRLQKAFGREEHILRLNRHSEVMGIHGFDAGKKISLQVFNLSNSP